MLRSWSSGLGSKLSTATTTPTDSDADDIALEIEQRKKGIDSLYTSTEAYWSYLGKRKPIPFDTSSLPASEDKIEKVLPVEALGLAMSSYSTAFPPHSTYGSCLGLLGEAHLELGALQSTFTKDTSRIFLARIARSKATLESFTAALKKLDAASARLDSAKAKVQKSKKEKRELEEEFRSAQAGYDEAVADVEKREEAVRESEGEDWVCLTKYLEAQMEYVMQARGVLEQVKARWSEAPAALATPMTRPRSSSSVALKTRPAISRRSSAKEAVEGETSRFASQSTLSLSNSDRPSTETDSENPKKNRLRMPSFTNTKGTDSVSSKTTSSFSRTRASSLFGSGETSPDKDKWGFGRKKGAGFVSMDGDAEEGGAPPRLPVRPKEGPGMRFSVDGSDDGMSSESPFSPATGSDGFLAVSRAHDTIHERGESQLSDIHTDHFLTSPPVGLHHTGLSAYSEGGDPFSGGAMSPQGTGGQFDSDDEEAGERQRLTVGGGARADNAGGWRGVMSEMVESGGVKGRLPPPVPGYVKGRSRTPPPPPLPSRNSS
ncbi:BAR adaptor protein [Pseudozyma hubeiensis SY62]|uniref:BAR adaptor protein n=1 Tax=Pseudozyma hubeiensis (strain SY62) TaxID=1305764 RepID=R9PBE8_PSEHS|nr:BAR adaptor protein [Pseudozyma hubeiensis SY62]GAC98733.1 BAR adaptor protein [Pseudozyma hubeiensis SY62]